MGHNLFGNYFQPLSEILSLLPERGEPESPLVIGIKPTNFRISSEKQEIPAIQKSIERTVTARGTFSPKYRWNIINKKGHASGDTELDLQIHLGEMELKDSKNERQEDYMDYIRSNVNFYAEMASNLDKYGLKEIAKNPKDTERLLLTSCGRIPNFFQGPLYPKERIDIFPDIFGSKRSFFRF